MLRSPRSKSIAQPSLFVTGFIIDIVYIDLGFILRRY